MTCRRAERWMSDEMDGRLQDSRRTRLADHLAKCPDCRAYRERLAAVQREAGALLRLELPDGYWEAWEDGLRSRLFDGAGRPFSVRNLRPAWKWAWAGIPATALAVLALLVLQPRRPVEEWPVIFPGDALTYLDNEIARDPGLAENFNRILAESIDEALGTSGIFGTDEQWSDPLFWESLSLEDMEMIEAALMAENGS